MSSHKRGNKQEAERTAQKNRQVRLVMKDLRKGNTERHLTLQEQLESILTARQAFVTLHGVENKVAIELLKFAASYERTIQAQQEVADAKAKAKLVQA